MRPITNFTLHAMLAVALTAIAATSAAAGPAYLKLGDIKGEAAAGKGHKGEIEVHSFHWGPRQSTSRAGMPLNGSKTGENAKGGNVEFEWKVEEGESAPPDPGGVRVASGDVDGDGTTEKRQHAPVRILKEWEASSPSGAGEEGGTEDINIGVGELQKAPAAPAGKATPKLIESAATGKVFAQPAAAGSLTFRGRIQGCAVGQTYRHGELITDAMRYEMEDVMVSSCGSGPAGGNSLPMEGISFNYGRIRAVPVVTRAR